MMFCEFICCQGEASEQVSAAHQQVVPALEKACTPIAASVRMEDNTECPCANDATDADRVNDGRVVSTDK